MVAYILLPCTSLFRDNVKISYNRSVTLKLNRNMYFKKHFYGFDIVFWGAGKIIYLPLKIV